MPVIEHREGPGNHRLRELADREIIPPVILGYVKERLIPPRLIEIQILHRVKVEEQTVEYQRNRIIMSTE